MTRLQFCENVDFQFRHLLWKAEVHHPSEDRLRAEFEDLVRRADAAAKGVAGLDRPYLEQLIDGYRSRLAL